MSITAYQQKGRDHIRYINRRAHNLWEKYGYRSEAWPKAIREALHEHIKYLEDADRLNREIEDRENKKRDDSKDVKLWWRNAKTGKWEPLIV